MLENLRRKSLVKAYNDPRHRVYFESGLAKYENHAEIDVCTQRLSKNLQQSSFPRVIDTISSDVILWFRFNMIYCPKGTFTMGHEDLWNNKPKIETIKRPFLLGETEITQELYQAVMGDNPSLFTNPYYKNPQHQNPVEQVSWVDAIKFCNELSKLQGLDECYTENPKSLDFGWDCDSGKNGYRLPEEKEWEYAAKAGTENRWAGTDQLADLLKYTWSDKNSDLSTHSVKTKAPNEWGFYDMSGNVDEWCWDKYNPSDSKPTANRIVRGGNWCSSTDYADLRVDSRTGKSPKDCNNNIGFRVARSVAN